jgi:hypothetical protein
VQQAQPQGSRQRLTEQFADLPGAAFAPEEQPAFRVAPKNAASFEVVLWGFLISERNIRAAMRRHCLAVSFPLRKAAATRAQEFVRRNSLTSQGVRKIELLQDAGLS